MKNVRHVRRGSNTRDTRKPHARSGRTDSGGEYVEGYRVNRGERIAASPRYGFVCVCVIDRAQLGRDFRARFGTLIPAPLPGFHPCARHPNPSLPTVFYRFTRAPSAARLVGTLHIAAGLAKAWRSHVGSVTTKRYVAE